MEVWEKSEGKKKDIVCLITIPLHQIIGHQILSWTVLQHFLLYFSVVTSSNIKYFCRYVTLSQFAGFSWELRVKYIIKIKGKQHNRHLLASLCFKIMGSKYW